MVQPVILLLVLIFLNATFASAEIAVISMNETKLKQLAFHGDSRALKLVSLTEQPAKFLATIQVAITLAGLLQSAFAAENFAGPLVRILVQAGVTIPENVLRSAAIVMITLVLAYFNLVLGELVPKRIAMKKSESMALGMSKMLYLVSKIFAPLVWLLTVSTNLILRLIGMNPEEEEEAVSEEEIRLLLLEGNEKGTIQAEETEMIQNIFEFDDISVEEICTHRREVITLSVNASEEKWRSIILANRHTHYPVCGEDQDDILGILDTKDYFRMEDQSMGNVMKNGMDPAFFVPEGMKANLLFRQMKEKRTYFAVLIDEYGGMSGIITLHDLMESLVGELDEKEEPAKPRDIESLGENRWRIQGSTDLDDVEETVGEKLPTDVYDTFSGFICGAIGRVPDDGEQFTCRTGNLMIQVHQVKNHMVGATTTVKETEENL